MVEYNGKKIHFGSLNTEDFIIHKDPDRRDKYLTKAMKISNKDGELTYQLPSYPNYWSVKHLNLKEIIFSLYKRMQLSSIENITEDNILFHTAKKHKVPNSKIKYQRIKIERKLPNGKFSPLVAETPFLFFLWNK